MIFYIFSNEELSSLFGELFSDLLYLVGSYVVESYEYNLVIFVEEFEAFFDGDLLLVSSFH